MSTADGDAIAHINLNCISAIAETMNESILLFFGTYRAYAIDDGFIDRDAKRIKVKSTHFNWSIT